jgi:threonylcarbamoyladenosine tRNA methylthiotransferase MtaB
MKVGMATLGCKVNQYESAGIAEALVAYGFDIVPIDEHADYYIINTCTVTGRSDIESRRLIRRAARINPRAHIVVTGCYAKLAAETLKKMPGVALVTNHKALIPASIAAAKAQQPLHMGPAESLHDHAELRPVRFRGHTRAFLKIQDGCSSRCSYCIVPLARGPNRSVPEKDVIDRMAELRRAGFREIVLTGIHLGIYGTDLNPATDLTRMVKRIHEDRAVERLRLSSIEPLEITDELIELLQRSEMICRHLHIPLQSADDGILKRMGRPYDSTFFARLLERIWSKVPDLGVGVDVMVGFPGEDERAFLRSLQFIADLPVAYLHVFPYSERPGTAAAGLPGKVPDADKKIRTRDMRMLGANKRMHFAKRFIGSKLRVLVEGKPDPETGLWRGFSDNYIPVLLRDGNASLVNHIVDVFAEEAREGKLLGKVMHD